MLGLAHRGFSLNDYHQTLIHALRSAGYQSVLAGLQHIARDSKTVGYDQDLHEESIKPWPTISLKSYSGAVPGALNHVEYVMPRALKWLAARPKQPFFLDIGVEETHRPFPDPGLQEDARYCLPPTPLPDTPETRQDMAAFKASVRLLDDGVGRVLQALERYGLAENTLVIYTTDHGVGSPTMKCNLTDSGIGVAMILRGPGGFTGGQVCDATISQMDLFPTLCELLQIPTPNWLLGRSFLSVIGNRMSEVNDEIFAEVNYHAAYEPMRAVRTRRWKYIRRFSDRMRPVLPNCDDGPSKQLWVRLGWRDRTVAAEELYDLVFDPNETRDLAEQAAFRGTRDEMAVRLTRWIEATNDPILRGPVPAPPGARVNDPDGLSPTERPRVIP